MKWQNVGGTNLLMDFYNDQETWAALFQGKVLHDFLKREVDGPALIERSPQR